MEQLMSLYLGRLLNKKKITSSPLRLNPDDLMTHTLICGSTGSGKTVLGKLLIEEAARAGIASIIIDLKGDLSSMAIPISKITYTEFEPWIDARDRDEREKKAGQIVDMYKSNMKRTGVDPAEMENFRNSVDIRIYTPRAKAGEKVSMSLINSPASDTDSKNEELTLNMLSVNCSSILERIYPEFNSDNLFKEKAFLESALHALWSKNLNLEGKKGIVMLIKEVLNPSFDKVGVFKTQDFISGDTRKDIAVRLNTLLVGAQALWYEGTSIDRIIKEIDTKASERTKVAIFNLSFLERFEDKSMVVSQIAFQLFNHFRKKIDSVGPRVIFYIDEIGAGEHSYFPAEPFHNASKTALNILLRQGRAFGICTILSTQNPGDIDYTALTNCHTWFVGKLLTAEDRKRVIEGIAAQELQFEDVDDIIKTAETGEFLIKMRNGDIRHFQERWLYTFHKVVSHDEFEKIHYAINFTQIYNKGINLLNQQDYAGALVHFEKAAVEDPDDSKIWTAIGKVHDAEKKYQKAFHAFEKAREFSAMDENCWLDSALILYKLNQKHEAIKYLEHVVKLNREHVHAWYKMGRIRYELNDFENADNALKEALKHQTKHYKALYIRGLVNVELDKKDQARDFFEKAIELKDDIPGYYQSLGDVLFDLDNFILALEAFEKAIALDSSDLNPRFGRARVFVEIDEFNKALEEIEDILKIKPKDSRALLLKAEMSWRADNYAKAIEAYQVVLDMDSQNTQALLRCGISCSKCGHFDMALTYLEEFVSKGGTDYDAFCIMGDLYEKNNEKTKAADFYMRAEELEPGNCDLIKKTGLIFYEKAEYDKAFEWFEKITHLSDDKDPFWYMGAISYIKKDYADCAAAWCKCPQSPLWDYDFYKKFYSAAMACEDYKLALDNINRALRMKNNSDDTILKARLYHQLKRYEDALDIYDILKKQEPENPAVWINMADTFQAIKEDVKADYCRNEAVKFGWKE
jgi:tetratricopeptide (TPR) repeat protein